MFPKYFELAFFIIVKVGYVYVWVMLRLYIQINSGLVLNIVTFMVQRGEVFVRGVTNITI